ncbi:cytochrome c [Methylotenera sp.]|uniref:c-type cytochrome n=1 Tax=Methylotenera sp. TaxID=2051956 RepID=UPI0027186778|nr:cytochrome c [Methylotenera sp.]MDO9392700.1 cytochrome c [Methylotenera sp.]MDP1521849.1 cytochrome c [Methylotenera sp.]MDP2070691.1 cytochrome c [Methylotenera sp.]MDP2231447.1 cytochrome c [Methylotenera sp.]MDP3004828.1 cytochrome c [Methylotenera sp.]
MLGNKTLKSALFVSLFALTGLVSVNAIAADIALVSTQDGSPLNIKPEAFDTPVAKEFLATGKNKYVGNEEAIKAGKKKYNLYSCNACHGGHGEGAIAPGLTGATMKYAKNLTNKGMFETIWHGTNGGMGAKGLGLMVPDDPTEGLKVDDLLKVVAFIRSHSTITGNE